MTRPGPDRYCGHAWLQLLYAAIAAGLVVCPHPGRRRPDQRVRRLRRDPGLGAIVLRVSDPYVRAQYRSLAIWAVI